MSSRFRQATRPRLPNCAPWQAKSPRRGHKPTQGSYSARRRSHASYPCLWRRSTGSHARACHSPHTSGIPAGSISRPVARGWPREVSGRPSRRQKSTDGRHRRRRARGRIAGTRMSRDNLYGASPNSCAPPRERSGRGGTSTRAHACRARRGPSAPGSSARGARGRSSSDARAVAGERRRNAPPGAAEKDDQEGISHRGYAQSV